MSKKVGKAIGVCVSVLLIFSTLLLISWGINVGIFYLLCLCFSWAFSWDYATGIWIIVLAFTVLLYGTISAATND